jgi:hypothetical protein
VPPCRPGSSRRRPRSAEARVDALRQATGGRARRTSQELPIDVKNRRSARIR